MAPWLFAASRVCDIGFQQTALMNCRFGREGPEPEVLDIMETGGENRRFAMGFDMDRKYTNTCMQESFVSLIAMPSQPDITATHGKGCHFTWCIVDC